MWHMGHMIAFDLRAAAPAADPGEFGPVPRSSTLVVVVVVVVSSSSSFCCCCCCCCTSENL